MVTHWQHDQQKEGTVIPAAAAELKTWIRRQRYSLHPPQGSRKSRRASVRCPDAPKRTICWCFTVVLCADRKTKHLCRDTSSHPYSDQHQLFLKKTVSCKLPEKKQASGACKTTRKNTQHWLEPWAESVGGARSANSSSVTKRKRPSWSGWFVSAQEKSNHTSELFKEPEKCLNLISIKFASGWNLPGAQRLFVCEWYFHARLLLPGADFPAPLREDGTLPWRTYKSFWDLKHR